jgi:type III secretory pathway component EscR
MLAAKVNCVVDSGDHLDDFQKSASWSLVAVFILASLRFAWSLGYFLPICFVTVSILTISGICLRVQLRSLSWRSFSTLLQVYSMAGLNGDDE